MTLERLLADLKGISGNPANSQQRRDWARGAIACLEGLAHDLEGAALLRQWWANKWAVDMDLGAKVDEWAKGPRKAETA
jgi:hypothetical protein